MRERLELGRRSPRSRKPASDAGLCSHSTTPEQRAAQRLEALIGLEIRSLRKSKDLTVAELGAAAGISTGMLSKVENGAISPSLATLHALATALSVPITRLFTRIDDQRCLSAEPETRKRTAQS
jgi:DNA-binding XRE family transcriptional regulator